MSEPVNTPARIARRRRVGVFILLAFVPLAAAELVARWGLGLGDPPLFVKDDAIEYLLKPGTYHRFGQTISINRWSQRSPDIEPRRTDPREVRVLVLGDSVVYGGAQLDDTQLATTLAEKALRDALGRPVRVLNIAAGSWGPQNQLAYVRRFGLFDADVAVIVWSSHDAWDVPRFASLGPDLPERTPTFALAESISRYLLPRLRRAEPAAAVAPGDIDEACASAAELLAFLNERGIPTRVLLHSTRGELRGTPDPSQPLQIGRERLQQVIVDAGTSWTGTGEAFSDSLSRGESPFRDDIHPSAEGQKLLADLLEKMVRSAVER